MHLSDNKKANLGEQEENCQITGFPDKTTVSSSKGWNVEWSTLSKFN